MVTKQLSRADMVLLTKASKVEPAFLPETLQKLMEPAVLGVKALANQVQAVKDENGRYNTPMMPRVAFMFLTRGPLPLAPLWDKFFDVRPPWFPEIQTPGIRSRFLLGFHSWLGIVVTAWTELCSHGTALDRTWCALLYSMLCAVLLALHAGLGGAVHHLRAYQP